MDLMPPASQVARVAEWALSDNGIRSTPENSAVYTCIEVTAQPCDASGQPCESWQAESVHVSVQIRTTRRGHHEVLGEGVAGVLRAAGLGEVTSRTAGQSQGADRRTQYLARATGRLDVEGACRLVDGPVSYVPVLPDPLALAGA